MSGLKDGLYPALPVFAQNLACSFAGWQRARLRFTPHFHRTLAAWELSGAATPAALHAIQRDRLFRLVEHARRHVPYYCYLPPPCERSDPQEAIARSLAAWPTLEKQTYRDRSEEFIARDLPRKRLIRGKTSGTTGTALPLWYTREALARSTNSKKVSGGEGWIRTNVGARPTDLQSAPFSRSGTPPAEPEIM